MNEYVVLVVYTLHTEHLISELVTSKKDHIGCLDRTYKFYSFVLYCIMYLLYFNHSLLKDLFNHV